MSDQPPPPPPPGYPQQPIVIVQEKKSGCMRTGLIVLGVLAILGVLMVGCLAVVADETVKQIEKETGPANAADFDIAVAECEIDVLDLPQAGGTITNKSDVAQGFKIEVTYTDDDGARIGDPGLEFVDTLAPGKSARWSTGSFTTVEGDIGELGCEPAVSYSILDDEEDPKP